MSELTAVRADGGLVRIRPVTRADRDALRSLDAHASDASIRRRFFTLSRSVADQYTDHIAAAPDAPGRVALVGVVGADVVGLATLETLRAETGEVALLVADNVQGEGIGTLLLEALVVAARERNMTSLVADVLTDNMAMHKVLHELGLPIHTNIDSGTSHVTISLYPSEGYLAAVTERERVAEAASLRPLRAPKSIVVVGAGTREHSVGRAVLQNLTTCGYTGQLFVVNPHHSQVLGVTSFPSCDALPLPPDLVVVAVPADQVADVIQSCGLRGARTVVLLTAGFGESGSAGAVGQAELMETARKFGMRLVGPNCLGVVNTDPAVSMNATFAPIPMHPGGVALASQSGAVGIAVAAAAERRGLGLAEFVSVGNKADVSSNDLILAWDHDPRVAVIALYLESFGNPRKFTRIARTVARHKPILALKSGRGVAGQRAGQSHTAAAAAAEPVVSALFAQVGVQRVDTMEQLIDAARVLQQQPCPEGDRVAIIGNSGGPGILAADAAEAAGLQVIELTEATCAQIRSAAPAAASVRNPVDLGAAVPPAQVAAAIRALVEADEVDAVVTVFTETLAASPDQIRDAVVSAARSARVPVIATDVGARPGAAPVPGSTRSVPVFGFPEPALAALATAVRAGRVMAAAPSPAAVPGDIDVVRARALVEQRLSTEPGWLAPDEAEALLKCFGISVVEQQVVRGAAAAVTAANALGYPVVAKLARGIHKSDTGGVRLNLRDEEELRAAVDALTSIAESDEVLVQATRARGVELILGGIQDPQFGPLVMLGAGGVLTDLLHTHSLRLAPLTQADATAMVESADLAQLLDGFRGGPRVSRAALSELLLRLSRLVDALPEVLELDLNPVICVEDNLVAVDAKIRVGAPHRVSDPSSRILQ